MPVVKATSARQCRTGGRPTHQAIVFHTRRYRGGILRGRSQRITAAPGLTRYCFPRWAYSTWVNPGLTRGLRTEDYTPVNTGGGLLHSLRS